MSELTSAYVITALAYVVSGSVPPVVAYYMMKVRFLGGIWVAMLIGLLGAALGGLAETLVPAVPDLLLIAGAVDIVPPFLVATFLTFVYGLISRSNDS